MTEKEFVAIDSLVANEFDVEIDGSKLTGIFSVSGLVAYQLDSSTKKSVVISKMVQRDPNNTFNSWLRETENKGKEATRDVAIVAVDDGVETRRWILKGAYIVSVSYSEFNSALSELVAERVEIEYGSVEHRWSGQ